MVSFDGNSLIYCGESDINISLGLSSLFKSQTEKKTEKNFFALYRKDIHHPRARKEREKHIRYRKFDLSKNY
jgi:hypothetical protein